MRQVRRRHSRQAHVGGQGECGSWRPTLTAPARWQAAAAFSIIASLLSGLTIALTYFNKRIPAIIVSVIIAICFLLAFAPLISEIKKYVKDAGLDDGEVKLASASALAIIGSESPCARKPT